MMCDFCKKIYAKNDEAPNADDFLIKRGDGMVDIVSFTGDSGCWGGLENVKYCPYCGRKLEGG